MVKAKKSKRTDIDMIVKFFGGSDYSVTLTSSVVSVHSSNGGGGSVSSMYCEEKNYSYLVFRGSDPVIVVEDPFSENFVEICFRTDSCKDDLYDYLVFKLDLHEDYLVIELFLEDSEDGYRWSDRFEPVKIDARMYSDYFGDKCSYVKNAKVIHPREPDNVVEIEVVKF